MALNQLGYETGQKPAEAYPAKDKSDHNRLYLLLRQKIRSLDLTPGTKLSENSLCAKYGVGRPGIRGILSRLSVEGCVEVIPQSGTFVTHMSADHIYQIAKARILIGQKIIRTVCGSELASGQSEALRQTAGRVAESGSTAEYLQRYEEFAGTLAKLCGRSHAWDFLDSVSCDFERAQVLCFRTYGEGSNLSYSMLEQGKVETRMLMESIERRDADAACLILESHYNQILIQTRIIENYYPTFFSTDGTIPGHMVPRDAY